MASKYLQKYPVPAGFQQILADFTRQVLRDQPPNIIQYAAKYFQMLQKGQKFQFNSKFNVSKQDKKYQLNYNPKNAQEITKKAANIAARVQDSGKPANNKPIPKPAQSTKHETKVQTKKAPEPKQPQKSARASINQQAAGPSVPPQVINQINKIFDQVDVNRNGTIQSKQIRRAVEYFAQQSGITQKVNEEQIKQFVKLVDTDKDGKISRKQFIDFIVQMIAPLMSYSQGHGQSPAVGTEKTVNQQQVQNYMSQQDQKIFVQQMRQQINLVFQQFDRDNSGFLESKQIKQVIKNISGGDINIDPSMVDQFKAHVDTNRDGKISRQEFVNFVMESIGFGGEEEEHEEGQGYENQQEVQGD